MTFTEDLRERRNGWTTPARLRRVAASSHLPRQPTLPRIKVLHVITKFSTGAGGNTLLSATGMDCDRYEVMIAGCTRGPEWERPLWERAEASGIKTYKLPSLKETIDPLRDLVVLFQLMRLIRKERFTIVHTHTAKAGFLGRLAAVMCRTPVIVHTYHSFPFHEFLSRRRRAFYWMLEKLVSPVTDAFFAVSPRVAREAVERRLAPPGRISPIPSAVELDGIPERADDVRAELGLPEGAPLVGTVGRIDFQKAPLDFVRMAARVASSHPEARFIMVGDGPMIGVVRDEARRLGVEIVMTGFRSDAVRLATAFDVFVITSLYEGLGRALTEALASGRPVVATAVNGVPDLVVPGVTGLLARPADPPSLAECVDWVLDHPDEGRTMGRQGRAIVNQLFDPRLMCEALDDAYRRLLGLTETAGASHARISWDLLEAGEPSVPVARKGTL